MSELPDAALVVVAVVVIVGALLLIGGKILADVFFGRVPGGRGK